MPDPAEPCPDCGASVAGGREACQALWDSLAYGSSVLTGAAFDAYCLQHLPRYCASAKSYAAHLTRLCCGIEFGGSAQVHAALQRWLNGAVSIEKPSILADRGSMTIFDVAAADTDAERAARCEQWVAAVWQAYAPQHALARGWIHSAMAGR